MHLFKSVNLTQIMKLINLSIFLLFIFYSSSIIHIVPRVRERIKNVRAVYPGSLENNLPSIIPDFFCFWWGVDTVVMHVAFTLALG